MRDQEQDLVNGCLQGNEKAWEDLVRSYSGRIFSLSYRFTRHREDAEDITQEVFARVYRNLRTYRAESGNLSGWLLSVARNLVIDHHRKKKRAIWIQCEPERIPPMRENHPLHPIRSFEEREAERVLGEALAAISPRIREVLELRDLAGMEYTEVAAYLRIPTGTVKSRIVRGHRELARILNRQRRNGAVSPKSKI